MARMARLVVPNYPHHVTQRGGRRQAIFFSDDDYRLYIRILAKECGEAGVDIWAYCLMPNHVHLVAVPESKEGLSNCFKIAHREYAREVNNREGWRGHLWQERFFSVVMDESYLMSAVRYVELNPVRAGICSTAFDWPWSSARAHLHEQDDDLVNVKPLTARVTSWSRYLDTFEPEGTLAKIREHSRTGRPVGDECFLKGLEERFGVPVIRRKPGPKKRN